MDADTKDKEIPFLKDKVYQLEMQVSILRKRIQKQQKKPRYTLRERLFILWHIETFGIARRKVADHLVKLCEEFEDWYNRWRPHMSLDGLRPDDVYYNKKTERPQRGAKAVPTNIEQHLFRETRVTGYRPKDVA